MADVCPSSVDTPSLGEKIKSLLGKYDVGSRYTHITLPKASILLPLVIRGGKPHLLLTVRSMHLRTMPGDVCFPGGRRDPADKDDIQTALRETQEEIGLCPEQVQVVGKLIPYISRVAEPIVLKNCIFVTCYILDSAAVVQTYLDHSLDALLGALDINRDSLYPTYMVTPIVGIVVDTFQPTPNPNEVADVFLVPLEFFLSAEHYTPLKIHSPFLGSLTVHQFLYTDPDTQKNFNIWGLTAHCAVMLSAMLLEKGPSFLPGFDPDDIIREQEKFLEASYNRSKL